MHHILTLNKSQKGSSNKSQKGSSLIIVMIVLVAITVLGLTAVNITTTEINLAANDKWQKTGFYNADPGIFGTPSIIYPNLREPTENPGPVMPADPDDDDDERCLEYINNMTPEEFYAFIEMAKEDVCKEDTFENKVISFRNCGILADIAICARGPKPLSGGGSEFGSAIEGLATSSGRGKEYLIRSTGDGASNQSNYTAAGTYLWLKAAGGLK